MEIVAKAMGTPLEVSKLDSLIYEMLEKGKEFCDHIGRIVTHKSRRGAKVPFAVAVCTHCQARQEGIDATRTVQYFLTTAQFNIRRYAEIKAFWDWCIQAGSSPEWILKLNKGDNMLLQTGAQVANKIEEFVQNPKIQEMLAEEGFKVNQEAINRMKKEVAITSDYKRGVEDAVREILENMPISGITDPVDFLNEIPRFVRRKLLNKKVTKWAMVVKRPRGENLPPAYSVRGDLHEGKLSAEQTIVRRGPEQYSIVGVFPIEIETEI